MAHPIIKSAIALLFVFTTIQTQAQRFFTKTGRIEFYSKAPLEEIRAVNKTVSAVMDAKTGAIQYAVLMKGFEFEKALMQEHFNENYVESDKYPKAEFKGRITNNAEINYSADGTYPAKVEGKLTIHGVTRSITVNGNIVVSGTQIQNNATFQVKLSDYNISIPAIVKDNLSNTIRVTVSARMEILK